MTSTTTKKTSAKKPRRMAREPKLQTAATQDSTEPARGANFGSATPPAGNAKPPTKSAIILGLLTRSQGATLGQLIEATGWLPHTTRAALTGLKKKGLEVTSAKADAVRIYRVIRKVESGEQDQLQPAELSDA
jgi:hypothetical protein